MIKKFCLIAVALLLVFISCKKTTSFSPLSRDIPVFKDIYSLKDTRPDSALKLFQAVADSLDMEKLCASSKDHYAEFQILEVELYYMNFLRIMNDSALSVAYAHFDSHMPGQSGDRVQMITSYDDYKADSQNARQKDLFFFVLFIIVVLLLILAVNIWLVRRHKRLRKKEREANEKIKALLHDEIENTKRTTQQKEEEIRSLEDKLDKVITALDFQSLSLDKKLEALREMPISKRVVKVKSVNVKAGYAYPEWVLLREVECIQDV